MKGLEQVTDRFWIDLQRGGHVVLRESYAPGKVLMGRVIIKLAPLKHEGVDVWMPISGEGEGHGALKDGKPAVSKQPTSIETVYLVGGTLEFNNHHDPSVFTMSYKPGTPISDNLRQVQSDFGRQTLVAKPTKTEAETMLREQVAKAEEQRQELRAGSPTAGFPWSTVLVWAFGGSVVVLSIVLLVQRGRR